MRTLSLDPSITCTGFAIFDGELLIDAGKIKTTRNADTMARIMSLCDDVMKLANEHQPTRIVIEVTSGKVSNRHKGGGAGLGTYGMAVGAIFATCRCCCGAQLRPVYENEWTQKQGSKSVRIQKVAAMFAGRYNPEDDKGGDVADAILLGMWTIRRFPLVSPRT